MKSQASSSRLRFERLSYVFFYKGVCFRLKAQCSHVALRNNILLLEGQVTDRKVEFLHIQFEEPGSHWSPWCYLWNVLIAVAA